MFMLLALARKYSLVVLGSIILFPLCITAQKKFKLLNRSIYNNSTFSATYTKYTNWKYQYSNMAFMIKQQVTFDTVKPSSLGLHSKFYAELGFTKIIDSIWYTNTDIWEIQHNWSLKESLKNWTTSYSIYFTSQVLSRYSTRTTKTTTGSMSEAVTKKEWQAGFFNPMIFEFSYGKSFTFWKICKINLSMSQIRITADPIMSDKRNIPDPERLFVINDNTLVKAEFGFGIQTFIRKKINDHFRWEHSSRFFANGLSPGRINFDLRNSFIVNPLKHLIISFNTRLLYRPIKMPYLVQQRYDLVVGLEF
jgi:hypothetical protein